MKYIVPRKEMAQLGFPRPLIELISQLADFARTQEDLEAAQDDIETAEGNIETLQTDLDALEEEVATLPLLIPPARPLSIESTDITDALGFTPANVAGDTFTGDVTAPNFIGNLIGNADTATLALASETLLTARSIAATGDGAWSVSFDGSANVSAALTLATVNADVGTFGSTTLIPVLTVNAKGLVTAVSTVSLPPGGAWMPLAKGTEPIEFVSNGEGAPVMVAFNP